MNRSLIDCSVPPPSPRQRSQSLLKSDKFVRANSGLNKPCRRSVSPLSRKKVSTMVQQGKTKEAATEKNFRRKPRSSSLTTGDVPRRTRGRIKSLPESPRPGHGSPRGPSQQQDSTCWSRSRSPVKKSNAASKGRYDLAIPELSDSRVKSNNAISVGLVIPDLCPSQRLASPRSRKKKLSSTPTSSQLRQSPKRQLAPGKGYTETMRIKTQRKVRFRETGNTYYENNEWSCTHAHARWYSKKEIAVFHKDVNTRVRDIRLTEDFWGHPKSLPGTLLRTYMAFRDADSPGAVSPVDNATRVQHSHFLIGLERLAIRPVTEDYITRRQRLLDSIGGKDLGVVSREQSRPARLFARYIADLSAATDCEHLP